MSKKWDTIGTITHKRDNRKSYSVLFPNGRIKLCNRHFLKPVHEPGPIQAEAPAAPDMLPRPLHRSPRLKTPLPDNTNQSTPMGVVDNTIKGTKANTVNNSNGLHIIEFHSPTVTSV